MKITIIAGARPNFMKIAPVIQAIEHSKSNGHQLSYRLIHTGQHYDKNMSDDFFTQLRIPKPDVMLNAGGGTQAEQTAAVLMGVENELINNPCDLLVVVGDVTSTMAASISARKLGIKVAHIEAGIRSGDWTMPEEINRVVTDRISNYFFTTTIQANKNLIAEGVDESDIFLVGNTMIDTLLENISKLKKPDCWNDLNLVNGNYLILTLHRPSNVDNPEQLSNFYQRILKYSGNLLIIFPVHPRTKKNLESLGLSNDRVKLLSPMSYLEFNYLVKNAKGVITDSGGITEETTVMGVPCITLRNNTERPETVTIGTNVLVGDSEEKFVLAMQNLLSDNWKESHIPPLWDGKTAERILDIILNKFAKEIC